MSKRKRRPVAVDDSLESQDELPAGTVKLKRRKVGEMPKKYPPLAQRAEELPLELELLQSLYESVRNHKEEGTGRVYCTPFVRLPNKKSFPEYYEAIESPMDLSRIHHNLRVSRYTSVCAFLEDFDLLLKNAKMFYLASSKEYQDACALEDFLHLQLDNLECLSEVEKKHEHRRESSAEKVESAEKMEVHSSPQKSTRRAKLQPGELASPPHSSQSEDDKVRSSSSTRPGRRSQRVREEATQGRHPPDPSLEEEVDEEGEDSDFVSVVQSAEGGRRKKSKKFLKVADKTPLGTRKKAKLASSPDTNSTPVTMKKTALLPSSGPLNVKIALSDGIRSQHQKRSSTGGALQAGSVQDGKVPKKLTKALQKIFSAVQDKKDLDGRVLSHIFMSKPSRKLYPEYYLAILQPIDLTEIRRNLTSSKYTTVAEFLEDMNLLFKNAQTFNEEESSIYHDSVTLSNLVCHQLKEMWKVKAPTSEDLPNLLTKMTSAQPPKSFPIVGHKGEFVLSPSTHAFLGLARGDLFKWFPDMKVSTTADQRKDISKRGLCRHSMVALRVIPVEELKPFYQLKSQGHTGKELVKAMVPKMPRSRPRQVEDDQMDTDEPKASPEGLTMEEQAMMKELLSDIYKAKGLNGRLLSTTFHQVPQKWAKADHSYPTGKRLIDLQLISEKMALNQYQKMEEMFEDLHAMCNAVCRLTSTSSSSTHYCDAIWLHNFVLQKRHALLKGLRSNYGKRMNAKSEVQAILRKIMRKTLRVKSTSHGSPGQRIQKVKIPEGTNQKQEEEIVELKTIIANVEKGYYHRLDRLQDDLMGLLDYIRRSNEAGSQLYQDAIDLTRAYLKHRDQLCENGERLSTPALTKLTQSDFELDVQASQDPPTTSSLALPPFSQKLQEEQETPRPTATPPAKVINQDQVIDLLPDDGGDEEKREYTEEVEYKGHTYYIGDYVYVKASQPDKPHHIVLIEKIWKNKDSSDYWFNGAWFFRPEETFHVATRRFYEKELFKTEFSHMILLSQVKKKCYVMFIKDYVKSFPEGYDPEDVYVCESRYIRVIRVFKKYKTWSVPGSHHPTLIKRSEPFTIPRVSSVFLRADEQEQGTGSGSTEQMVAPAEDQSLLHDNTYDSDSSSDEESESDVDLDESKEEEFVDYDWENVQMTDSNPEPFCSYFEQFVIDGNRFRIGDYVFVRSDQSRPFIARIDRMWTDRRSDPWFSGPWFVRPSEVDHLPTRLFYPNEVFLSSIQDTNPMRSVIGRCAVLTPKEFVKSRPTEVFEDDMFVCGYKYNESDKEIKRARPFKTHSCSRNIVPDEVYYFKEEIPLVKVASPNLQETMQSFLPIGLVDRENPFAPKPPPPKTTEPVVTPRLVLPPSPLATPVSIGTVSNPRPTMSSTDPPGVPMAISLMAEDVQKQMLQRSVDMPLDVVTRVVAAEWPKMSEQQRLPYERKALIMKCASKIGIPGVVPTTSLDQAGLPQQPSAVSLNVLSKLGLTSLAPLTVATPTVTTPTLTTLNQQSKVKAPSSSVSNIQTPPTVAPPSAPPLSVKIGDVTLTPGMVLTPHHIQQLHNHQQTLPQHTKQTASTSTANTAQQHQGPSFLQEDGTKVIHGLLYLKYLDDLKKGAKQMSSWESISSVTQCHPDPQHLEYAASWVDDSIRKIESEGTSEREHMASIVDALKTMKDLMLKNSVDLANLVEN